MAGLGVLERGEGGAVEAVTAGVGAEEDHRIAHTTGVGTLEVLVPDEAHAHGVDQRVAVVRRVDLDLARDGGHAHAVSVPADAADDAFREVA